MSFMAKIRKCDCLDCLYLNTGLAGSQISFVLAHTGCHRVCEIYGQLTVLSFQGVVEILQKMVGQKKELRA